jgi:hypothetical protein
MISLNRFASGENWETLTDRFGGDATAFGRAFDWFVKHLFSSFYHVTCGDSLKRWVPMMDQFQTTIGEKFCATHSPFERTYYELLIDDFIIDMDV